ARKATRTWQQPPWSSLVEHGVPKSNLDGARESVIDESVYEAVRTRTKSKDWLREKFKARPGERLSGVDLLKRVGQESDIDGRHEGRPIFHSTSHISAGPIRTRIARLDPTVADRLAEALDRVGVDADRFRIAAGGAHVSSLSAKG